LECDRHEKGLDLTPLSDGEESSSEEEEKEKTKIRRRALLLTSRGWI